jgi:hypothetical protein
LHNIFHEGYLVNHGNLNELIAQLNASTGNILSDASRLNTTADNMNQTLDGIGVQEISGVAELLPDERQDMYRQQIYTPEQQEALPSTTQQVIDSSSYALPQDLGTNVPPQGILSQIKDAATNYFQSGGILGIGANILGGLLPDMDPRQQALREFYGYDSTGSVPQGQLMAGYNPVSGGLFSPTTYGLQNAYQKRIDMINRTLARKYADGNYSGTQLDERLKALQNAKIRESMMLDQVNQNTAYQNDIGDSYSGGETTTNVGGQNITSYNDPFDPGGGE